MSNFVKIIAFDLETTGLDATKEEIIEIGAIAFSVKESRGRIVPDKLDEFQYLIKASKPNNAIKINNIKDEDLLNAPSHPEVLKKFKTFCENANYMVAHNAPFDTSFLNHAYGKYSIAHPTAPILDSIKIARNILKLPDYKLGTIAKIFEAKNEISLKVSEEKKHRAVYDCEMLMHVLVALLRDRFSVQDWSEQEFLNNLKKKGILQDLGQIKPVRPKATGLF